MEDVIVVDSPVPDEATAFPGRWVAIRDRRVVADAESLAELCSNPAVRDEDILYPVPPSEHFF